MDNLRVGSLFSGIGGIDLAFQWAGFQIAWQVEIDDYCTAVLQKHWPEVKRFRDVCQVASDQLSWVDVVAGGFPCQDISLAGRGDGLAGDRSGLWWEMWRVIRDNRPRAVLLENVPAVTVRGGNEITASLAALGYGLSWGIISAADAGAPHKRDRWFCVGLLADPDRSGWGQQCGTESVSKEHTTAKCPSLGNPHGRGLSGDNRRQYAPELENRNKNQWASTQSRLGRVTHGLPAGLDGDRMSWPAGPGERQHIWEPPRVCDTGSANRAARLRALGNAVVPQVVYPIARELFQILGGVS